MGRESFPGPESSQETLVSPEILEAEGAFNANIDALNAVATDMEGRELQKEELDNILKTTGLIAALGALEAVGALGTYAYQRLQEVSAYGVGNLPEDQTRVVATLVVEAIGVCTMGFAAVYKTWKERQLNKQS